jgi:hypothetical protein
VNAVAKIFYSGHFPLQHDGCTVIWDLPLWLGVSVENERKERVWMSVSEKKGQREGGENIINDLSHTHDLSLSQSLTLE